MKKKRNRARGGAIQAVSASASGPPGRSITDSTSIIGVPIGLPAATFEQFGRNSRAGSGGWRRRMPPVSNDHDHQAKSKNKGHARYRPSQTIEAVRRRLCQYRLA